MTLNRRTLPCSSLLRLSLVLALFAMLDSSHAGKSAMSPPPQMGQHHAGDMADLTPNQTAGAHDKLYGALCALVCSGADKMAALALLAPFEKGAIVRWAVDAAPISASQHPDPAQRPPDTDQKV